MRDTTVSLRLSGIDHSLLDVTVQPNPFNSLCTKSISLQFRKKDIVGDNVKDFREVQTNDICSPPLNPLT